MNMTASLRSAHATAGVQRCFKGRNAGRYAFMCRQDAVRHCKAWIQVLRVVRTQNSDEPAAA
jgi:hypothetical protein